MFKFNSRQYMQIPDYFGFICKNAYNNQLMLRKVRDIPIRYYHLALLNLGLIIALSKEMSLISILTSLVFVGLAVAPFAVFLGLLSPPPHQIVHDEILNKMRQCQKGLVDFFSKWESLKQQQKQKTIIFILLAIYISSNFICPCMQTFAIVNVAFAYFFMQEEVEWIKGLLCRLYEGKCPLAE